ncbi:MAG: pyridoxamine 5'-phosphate oxidase family protein [Clostridiales bacterium]|nr:pyridoxamine 5'-phosphate oxidase family protein [Clostridiales bacterium]
MAKLYGQTRKIMEERFGKDNIIALATTQEGIPHVRYVNALYFNETFYIITYALSRKMKQIEANPAVAIAGEWFTAHGNAVNLGYFEKPENAEIAKKLRAAFAEWIDNGHNDFNDINTCILSVQLTTGVLFSHGTRYDIDFNMQ